MILGKSIWSPPPPHLLNTIIHVYVYNFTFLLFDKSVTNRPTVTEILTIRTIYWLDRAVENIPEGV